MFLCCVLGWVNLHVSSLRAVCHAQQFYSFPGYNSHWFSEPGNLGAHLSCARPESWGFQCGEQAPLPLGKSFIFLDPSWLWISPLFLSVCVFLFVRSYLFLSYLSWCCSFSLCCGGSVHSVFRGNYSRRSCRLAVGGEENSLCCHLEVLSAAILNSHLNARYQWIWFFLINILWNIF